VQYQEAAVIARETNCRRSEGTALSNIAEVHRELGNFSEAMDFYQKTLTLHRETGNRRSEGIVIGNMAILYRKQGESTKARKYYTDAIEIHREVSNRPFVGLALGNLAFLEFSEGNSTEAEELYSQALTIHREIGNLGSEGMTLGNLAKLNHARGDLGAARDLYEKSIELCDKSAPVIGGFFRSGLALVCAEQGEFDLAHSLIDESERRVPLVYKMERGCLICQRAKVAFLSGDTKEAKRALTEAETLAKELDLNAESDLLTFITEAHDMIGGSASA